jgi:hypothetical protein
VKDRTVGAAKQAGPEAAKTTHLAKSEPAGGPQAESWLHAVKMI